MSELKNTGNTRGKEIGLTGMPACVYQPVASSKQVRVLLLLQALPVAVKGGLSLTSLSLHMNMMNALRKTTMAVLKVNSSRSVSPSLDLSPYPFCDQND